MRRVKRWEQNWRLIAPLGARRIRVPRSRRERRALADRLRRLPAGSAVVLAGAAPRAGARSRALAARAGLALDRTYLAFPSADAPAYLVEDAPASVRAFVRSVLVVPPGSTAALPFHAVVRLLRTGGAWRLLRVLAPGRVVVARRP